MKKLIEFGRRPLAKWLGIGMLALGVAAGTVIASHDFSDVPDTHVFHTQISNLVNAGITTGCAPGLYCPDNAVTRAQMAAFLTRTASRIGHSSALVNSTVTSAQGFVTVAQKQIVVPGSGAASSFQMVRVDGQFAILGDGTNCTSAARCGYLTRIDPGIGLPSSETFWEIPQGGGDWQTTVSHHWAFTAPSGSTRTYAIQVRIGMPGTWSLLSPSILVETAPFGATGGITLGPVEEEAMAGSDSTIAQ